MMIPQAIRTAGTALKQFLTDPKSLKQMGQSIAAETAFATAAQQAVPRMIGQRPAQSIPQSFSKLEFKVLSERLFLVLSKRWGHLPWGQT
jgi:hypothetical protein